MYFTLPLVLSSCALLLSVGVGVVVVAAVVACRRLQHRLPDKLTKRQNRCRHFRMLAPLRPLASCCAGQRNKTANSSKLQTACLTTCSPFAVVRSRSFTLPLWPLSGHTLNGLCCAASVLYLSNVRLDDAAAQKCCLACLRQTCLLAKMVCLAFIVVAIVVVVIVVGNKDLAPLGTSLRRQQADAAAVSADSNNHRFIIPSQ